MSAPKAIRPAHIDPLMQSRIIEQTLCYAFGVPLDELQPLMPNVSRIDLYDPPKFEQGFPKIIRITAASLSETSLLSKCQGWKCDFTHCSVEEELLRTFVVSAKVSSLITTHFLGSFAYNPKGLEPFDLNMHVKPFPDSTPQNKTRVVYSLSPYWVAEGPLGKLTQVLKVGYLILEGNLSIYHLCFVAKTVSSAAGWQCTRMNSPLTAPWNYLHVNRYDACRLGIFCMTERGLKPLDPAAKVIPTADQTPRVAQKEELIVGSLSRAFNLHAARIKALGSVLSNCSKPKMESVEGISVDLEIGLEAVKACLVPLLIAHKVSYLDLSRCHVKEEALIQLLNSVDQCCLNGITLNRALTLKEELTLQLQREVLLKRCPHLTFPLQFVNFLVTEKSTNPTFIEYFKDACKMCSEQTFTEIRLVACRETPHLAYTYKIVSDIKALPTFNDQLVQLFGNDYEQMPPYKDYVLSLMQIYFTPAAEACLTANSGESKKLNLPNDAVSWEILMRWLNIRSDLQYLREGIYPDYQRLKPHFDFNEENSNYTIKESSRPKAGERSTLSHEQLQELERFIKLLNIYPFDRMETIETLGKYLLSEAFLIKSLPLHTTYLDQCKQNRIDPKMQFSQGNPIPTEAQLQIATTCVTNYLKEKEAPPPESPDAQKLISSLIMLALTGEPTFGSN